MFTTSDEFVEVLALAAGEVLSERDSNAFARRYGLNGDRPLTLEEVGKEFGISRERVRQILGRAHRKIKGIGWRQVRLGQSDKACARLIVGLNNMLLFEQPGVVNRAISLLENEFGFLPFSHAVILFNGIAYKNKDLNDDPKSEIEAGLKDRLRAKIQDRKAEKATSRLQELLSTASWPSELQSYTINTVNWTKRSREVSSEGEGKAGEFFSAKLDRNVQYESQLELAFYMQLERSTQVVLYQEQPFAIFYEDKGATAQYYPDVFVVLNDKRGLIVEIKPVFQMGLYRNQLKWKALDDFCRQKGLGILITDGRLSIEFLREYSVHAQYMQAVIARLGKGTLGWREYVAIRDQFAIGRSDFVGMIVQNKLHWQLQPFELRLE